MGFTALNKNALRKLKILQESCTDYDKLLKKNCKPPTLQEMKKNLFQVIRMHVLLSIKGAETTKERDEIALRIDIKESLQRANSDCKQMIETGKGIISAIHTQDNLLKVTILFIFWSYCYQKARTHLVSFMNEMGLSHSLSHLIQRRSKNDCYLLAFCIFFAIFVILFSFFYLKPKFQSLFS